MTYLNELFSDQQLSWALLGGYVRRQFHPSEPLAILNYAEKAVFDKEWNDVTLQCRGLIYNTDTHEVVARPFRKFFNAQESTAPIIARDSRVTVTDKQDGSLGILYPMPSGGWAVSTRGSFASEQALHATELFNQRYYDWLPDEPREGLTWLFEIVYPENRIVVDYGRLDELVLLGAVDIATGRSYGPDGRICAPWPGPRTQVMPYRTYAEALAAPPRAGMEGVVVHDLYSDERVKLKQEDYIALHRIVTGLTSRRVHEAIMAGIKLDEFIAPLPDEFHDWVRGVAWEIEDAVRAAESQVDAHWKMVMAECEGRTTEGDWPLGVSMGTQTGQALSRDQRRLFAEVARGYSDAWALFSRLDGKDYRTRLLKEAQPEVETPNGRTFTEATA